MNKVKKGKAGAAGLVLIVKAKDVSRLFEKAGIALEGEMVNLKKVKKIKTRNINIQSRDLNDLLYKFLSDLLYLKETYELIFSGFDVSFNSGVVSLSGRLAGEQLNRSRHKLKVDVISILRHGFRVEKTEEGWKATIPLGV